MIVNVFFLVKKLHQEVGRLLILPEEVDLNSEEMERLQKYCAANTRSGQITKHQFLLLQAQLSEQASQVGDLVYGEVLPLECMHRPDLVKGFA